MTPDNHATTYIVVAQYYSTSFQQDADFIGKTTGAI